MSDKINIAFNGDVHKKVTELANLMSGPGESPFLIVFNKASGAHVGRVAGHLDTAKADTVHYKYKELTYDPTLYQWRGDYDTGELVDLNEAPVVISEEEIDNQTKYTIRDVYDWYHQTNAIMSVMEKLIEKNNLAGEEVEEFKGILEYIKARRESGEKFKSAYQENPDFEYETKKESIERMGRELDGGLHEEFGPKANQMPHDEMTEAPDVKNDNLWIVNQHRQTPEIQP